MNKVALKALSHAFAFVLGFSAVFIIAFGLPAAAISTFISKNPQLFGYIGGVNRIGDLPRGDGGLHLLLQPRHFLPQLRQVV